MNQSIRTFGRLALVLAAFALSGSAFAQASRTWVSGVGDDANPCSRTAPCKTFAGAISKTAAGGEINVLDPGGFGGVTITKSITINGLGFTAGITTTGTNSIIVNGAGVEVTLRNLYIDGLGNGAFTPGINGVNFLQGASLTIENCDIYGFSGFAVNFVPSSTAELFINDSTFHENTNAVASAGGVLVGPTGGASASATLNNVRLYNNSQGLRVTDGGIANIDDSVIAGNTNAGLVAQSAATAARITASDSQINTNGASSTAAGVKASGALAAVVLDANDISYNFIGLLSTGSGQILSYGNNAIHDNGTDGAPTGSALVFH